ncbi:MAG: hypothetical protein GXO14_05350 [Thermococci archaeon]|nr:hypothetical protein [Thermococci archaeon]
MGEEDNGCSGGSGGDALERYSKNVSSFSISLLPALLFVLVMSYILVVGLHHTDITLNVGNQTVHFRYPRVSIPLNYDSLKASVLYLFGVILIGLPVPLLRNRLRGLRVILASIQTAMFVYALYLFVKSILGLANYLI